MAKFDSQNAVLSGAGGTPSAPTAAPSVGMTLNAPGADVTLKDAGIGGPKSKSGKALNGAIAAGNITAVPAPKLEGPANFSGSSGSAATGLNPDHAAQMKTKKPGKTPAGKALTPAGERLAVAKVPEGALTVKGAALAPKGDFATKAVTSSESVWSKLGRNMNKYPGRWGAGAAVSAAAVATIAYNMGKNREREFARESNSQGMGR